MGKDGLVNRNSRLEETTERIPQYFLAFGEINIRMVTALASALANRSSSIGPFRRDPAALAINYRRIPP
ncbi:MAG: hypothetical protein ACRD2O_08135 [Terriglobia bacterium]